MDQNDKKVFYNYGVSSAAFIVLLMSLFCSAGCENKQGIKIGDTPPVISGNDIFGHDISRSKPKAKIVIIYFWTGSCCGDSLKLLEPLYNENKDKGVAILAVNVGDSNGSSLLKFAKLAYVSL